METVFVNGLIVKKAHENAPSFVKCKLSFKVDEMIAFLNEHNDDGWVNAEIKSAKTGKLYAELDQWKPNQSEPQEQPAQGGDSDIPF